MHLLDPRVAKTVVRLFPSSEHWNYSCSSTPTDTVHGGGIAQQKMELGNILNTKMPAKALAGTPMQYDMQHPMHPHELQQQQQQQQHPNAYPPAYLNPNGRIKSETNSERGASPHTSDSRYAPQPQQQVQYPSMTNGYPHEMRYPSPSAGQMGVPNQMLPYNPNAQAEQGYPPPQQQQQQQQQQLPQAPPQANGRTADTGPPKAFACSTCGKGFARRSDLARHGTFTARPNLLPPRDRETFNMLT
jgi:hypothetical protein